MLFTVMRFSQLNFKASCACPHNSYLGNRIAILDNACIITIAFERNGDFEELASSHMLILKTV